MVCGFSRRRAAKGTYKMCPVCTAGILSLWWHRNCYRTAHAISIPASRRVRSLRRVSRSSVVIIIGRNCYFLPLLPHPISKTPAFPLHHIVSQTAQVTVQPAPRDFLSYHLRLLPHPAACSRKPRATHTQQAHLAVTSSLKYLYRYSSTLSLLYISRAPVSPTLPMGAD
ncbi:hypothetical protein EV426DRAFT_38855 [Tirmania nivea]|nr:hypothetical protein EV426DRAFT_38855 [Tirmania nivea]